MAPPLAIVSPPEKVLLALESHGVALAFLNSNPVFAVAPSVRSEARFTVKLFTVRVFVPAPAAELVIVPAELPAPKLATVTSKPLMSRAPPLIVTVLLLPRPVALPTFNVPALSVVVPL